MHPFPEHALAVCLAGLRWARSSARSGSGGGTAAGLAEYGMAFGLTVLVFFAHGVLRRLSSWIERRAPPPEDGPR